MSDKQTILSFIRHFKDAQDTFLNGCCYWFSHILSVRFGGTTYYDPIYGHFVQKIGNDFYDVRGEVTHIYQNMKLVCWDTYQSVDPLHYQHIVRDCVLKLESKDV